MRYLSTLSAWAVLFVATTSSIGGCSTVYNPFSPVVNPEGRPVSAPCAFDSQCMSNRCTADVGAGACGECVTIVPLGQDCTGAHSACSISAVCTNGICQSLRKVEGEACKLGPKGDDYRECDVEFYCAHNGDFQSPGRCVRITAPGDTCTDSFCRCALGTTRNEDGICAVPIPGTCIYDHSCKRGDYCGDDHVCHQGTLAQDARCGIVDGRFIDNTCGPGLACGNLLYPNGGGPFGYEKTCIPLPAKGEPCIQGRCSDGLYCYSPPDETRLPPFCDSPRNEGEACSNSYRPIACAAGLECRDQVCRAACH